MTGWKIGTVGLALLGLAACDHGPCAVPTGEYSILLSGASGTCDLDYLDERGFSHWRRSGQWTVPVEPGWDACGTDYTAFQSWFSDCSGSVNVTVKLQQGLVHPLYGYGTAKLETTCTPTGAACEHTFLARAIWIGRLPPAPTDASLPNYADAEPVPGVTEKLSTTYADAGVGE